MANDDHTAQLMKGVAAWNAWREENRNIRPDLRAANLSRVNLRKANLRGADLSGTNLSGTNLRKANLRGACLRKADLRGADLRGTDLAESDLSGADLREADLSGTDFDTAMLVEQFKQLTPGADHTKAFLAKVELTQANLTKLLAKTKRLTANHAKAFHHAEMLVEQLSPGAEHTEAFLVKADLRLANLTKYVAKAKLSRDRRGANLGNAKLIKADLRGANLRGANLCEADLTKANLHEADLRGADLGGADLRGANLTKTNLTKAHLAKAYLAKANLGGAKLSGAVLYEAEFTTANLRGADLSGAYLSEACLINANFSEAKLIGAVLSHADLTGANLRGANLSEAYLSGANLRRANLTNADLRRADLENVALVSTILRGADLTDCHIYGISAWNLKLEGTKQQNLLITHWDEPEITVDNIEVAQLVYLLFHNEKIRDVIDTIGKKGVLLLGRFTEGRIKTLERLRDKLRSLGFVPMVFNFDKPETKDFTETVRLLANLSHFVIVDITNPRSAPLELQATVPDYMVPFVPILEKGQAPFSMFVDLKNKYDWVLDPVIVYPSVDRLIEVLEDKIIGPAQAKFNQLLARRTKQLRVEDV